GTRIAHEGVDLTGHCWLMYQYPLLRLTSARLHCVAGRAIDTGGGHAKSLTRCRCDGRSTKIRTLDPRFPKPVLYQAELHSEITRFVIALIQKGQARLCILQHY